MNGTILAGLSGVSAQDHEPAPPAVTSAGNMSADFYISSGCGKPDKVSLPKPLATDRESVLIYNNAIKHHNEYVRCIGGYAEKAPQDIEWIMFTVNSAVAKANGSNPPAAPTVPGNMPSGFYPSPDCIKPAEQLAVAPDVHDTKAMDAHNSKVKNFNAQAAEFVECIKLYTTRARVDIERIEDAQRAALQARG